MSSLSRYECLEQAARRFPTLDPSACEAYLNLRRTGQAISEADALHLGTHQISEGRFNVLMMLNREPEAAISPASLADEGGVTRATISGVLDTLERDGFVTRSNDPADRRGVLVQLTPLGRQLIEDICPGYFARVAEIIRPLAVPERKELIRLLWKIQDGLAESATPDSPKEFN